MEIVERDAAVAEFAAKLNASRAATLRDLMATGPVTLNSDDLFMLHPGYSENPADRLALGPLFYPIARAFTDWAFAELIAHPPGGAKTVVFTAGGGASGKSSVLVAQSNKEDVAFIVDTTFSDPARALAQVRMALQVGCKVEVNYVYRRFDFAVRGMLRRAQDPNIGRVVPIRDLARTHHGVRAAVLLVREEFLTEPRCKVQFWKTVESAAPQQQTFSEFLRRDHPQLDELHRQGLDVLNAICTGEDADWSGEKVSEALRRAAEAKE